MNFGDSRKTVLVMLVMLVIMGLIFSGIFGYKSFQDRMIRQSMTSRKPPPVTVTASKAEILAWQPQIKAVGTLRAVRGVEVTSEIAGLVRDISFYPGEEIEAYRVLVQLNAEADIAQLSSLEAAVELAKIVYDRDQKQCRRSARPPSTPMPQISRSKGRRLPSRRRSWQKRRFAPLLPAGSASVP